MDETSIIQYITDTFVGVHVATAAGDSFFSYDPDLNLEPDRFWPFATLVTSDSADSVSNLNRPGVFRLNIGVSKAIYQSLFGAPASGSDDEAADHDFTTLDQIMPHPIYGKMYWICVLNPSAATFETVRTLLAEAYELAVNKLKKRAPRE